MDFVSDCLANGQTFRTLVVVVDDYTRENLAVEVDTSISGLRVRRVLEAVVTERARPGGIVVDNGPEFRKSQSRARAPIRPAAPDNQ